MAKTPFPATHVTVRPISTLVTAATEKAMNRSLCLWSAIFCASFIGCTSAIGASPATTEHSRPAKDLKPYVVITGMDSHIKEPGCFRVTSREQWVTLWLRHTGRESSDTFESKYDDFYNPAGVPDVDFDKCMVIAVFQGAGVNSAGLKAVSVEDVGRHIVFRFEDKAFQTGGVKDGGGVKVNVYGFFVLPRSTRPVVVEEGHRYMKPDTPVWRERARFEALPSPKTN